MQQRKSYANIIQGGVRLNPKQAAPFCSIGHVVLVVEL